MTAKKADKLVSPSLPASTPHYSPMSIVCAKEYVDRAKEKLEVAISWTGSRFDFGRMGIRGPASIDAHHERPSFFFVDTGTAVLPSNGTCSAVAIW